MDLSVLLDVLQDSVWDTLELVPFLFVTYLAMEALEHSAGGASERLIRKAGHAGPLVGGLLGALPQCGFSAMAATLYAGRLVTAGTLVAVILSTSDELIPVFLANQAPLEVLLAILLAKVVIGVAVGFAVDTVLRALHRAGDGHAHIHELCERAHCDCAEVDEDDLAEEYAEGEADGAASEHAAGQKDVAPADGSAAATVGVDAHAGACGCHAGSEGLSEHAGHEHAGHSGAHHAHSRRERWAHIARSALVHTLQVTFFILVITFAFGLGIQLVGENAVGAVLSANPVLATLLAGLIGLIPNCGASVAITELFLDGTLGAGPMLAGLLVSGGMGLLVLYRTNDDLRQNVLITVFIYAVGVVFGLLGCVF
ncbi:MAG: putative manganese transporter [Atopobiaceae bacterium]